jgi:tetratricopeptide (TPR) repeat protein
MKKLYLLLIVFSVVSTTGNDSFAQSKKEFFKAGVANYELRRYEEAAANFGKAIKEDPNYFEAYVKRAECHEFILHYKESLEDYETALRLKPADQEISYHTGRLNLMNRNYSKAKEQFQFSSTNKSLKYKSLNGLAESNVYLGRFKEALEQANEVITHDKNNHRAMFVRGLAHDSLGEYSLAVQSYDNALMLLQKSKEYAASFNKTEFNDYAMSPAKSSIHNKDFAKALTFLQKAEEWNSKSAEVIYMKGKAYFGLNDYKNAGDEFNRAIAINNLRAEYFIGRGKLYLATSSFADALSDFSRAISLNSKSSEAYALRAEAHLGKNDFKQAMSDIEMAKKISPNNKEILTAFEKVKSELDLRQKESISPEIVIQSPRILNKGQLIFPDTYALFDIKGTIKDDSKIASISINDQKVAFDAESKNPSFTHKFKLDGVKTVIISASDIYGNNTTQSFEVIRGETQPPIAKVVVPSTNGNNLKLNDPKAYKVFVEGVVTDKSFVESIFVNNVSASFDSKKINPNFTANIDVAGVDSVIVVVTDIYGNTGTTRYIVSRSETDSEGNPMGKTWAVFIANSNYNQFPSLEAVSQDVASVKKAMNLYQIDSVITRRNMTKSEMERFFSIELRNALANNEVTSLLVWYSGHGRVTADNGYWLPVDASKKDEFSFFPTSNLKGYLSSYKKVKHTLVISDATETGPAFYLAMRDVSPWQCGDWEASRLKSAQVLSSSEPERLNESSMFSKVFSNALLTSQDKCITIDKVSEKVITGVSKNQKQKPRFGNIQDLGDENGTFFFIKK